MSQTTLSADDAVTSDIPAPTEHNKIYQHRKTSPDHRNTGFSEAGYLKNTEVKFLCCVGCWRNSDVPRNTSGCLPVY